VGLPLLLGTDDGILAVDESGAVTREHEGAAVSLVRREHHTWWAVADRRVVLRRDDGAWNEIARVDDDVTALLPVRGGAFLGTADGHLLRLAGSAVALVKGFDAVDGRDAWHAVGSRVPYVRSATTTSDGRALLASVHVGGIPRSGNGGASWKPTIDVEADVHEVRAHRTNPKLVAAAAAVGLCESTDAGVTWTVTTDGLHATYLRAIACTDDAIVTTASDGPFGSKCALYRRPLNADSNRGGLIQRVTAGLPEWLAGIVDTGMLDARGPAVAFADPEGTVFTSTDGSRSFTQHTTVDTRVRAVGILASPMLG
jgi:hypothetical protein